ncbi:uncharacterized protein PV06_08922 [Exophiala oligosperma]|uniref:Uncharacterized protein n=1 Tax=Exophiala oligosperma TaxID=215243 RepID=A0A0D2DU31_9EURO|nr:uncharacterized protein PV06_08922 [Exophiala oligosperma]KIW39114.1 hypothetical protein PV06_08922 [Exophiala oligosperma]
MRTMAWKPLLACFALLSFGQAALAQSLELSDCANNCISNITQQSSACRFGVQCFCNDNDLYKLVQNCWQSNCTIHEGLIAQNVTSISCNFPDRNRGPLSSAITFTSMAVALLLVGVRIVNLSRDFRTRWGWDDVVVAVATTTADVLQARSFGYGRDTWRLPFDHTKTVEMLFYIGGILYAVGVSATKIAFLLFYIRLFPSPILRRVAFPLLAITLLHGLIFTFLFIFQCSPVSYAWTQWDGTGKGKCLDFDLGAVLHAITNILLDFLIFALPITQLWKLNLSHKKKIQVLSMFCVGFFVTLVSILRLWSLIKLNNTWNPAWDFVPLGYFSDLEFNVGIACICMPSVRVVLRRYFPGCGISTTNRERTASDHDIQARRVNLTDTSNGKNFKSFISSRHVARDDSSDQVELCEYNPTEATSEVNISGDYVSRPEAAGPLQQPTRAHLASMVKHPAWSSEGK